MRPYDCKGDVSDRNARAWRVGMHEHGGSAHASMSYNLKRKSCNKQRIYIVFDYEYRHLIPKHNLELTSFKSVAGDANIHSDGTESWTLPDSI